MSSGQRKQDSKQPSKEPSKSKGRSGLSKSTLMGKSSTARVSKTRRRDRYRRGKTGRVRRRMPVKTSSSRSTGKAGSMRSVTSSTSNTKSGQKVPTRASSSISSVVHKSTSKTNMPRTTSSMISAKSSNSKAGIIAVNVRTASKSKQLGADRGSSSYSTSVFVRQPARVQSKSSSSTKQTEGSKVAKAPKTRPEPKDDDLGFLMAMYRDEGKREPEDDDDLVPARRDRRPSYEALENIVNYKRQFSAEEQASNDEDQSKRIIAAIAESESRLMSELQEQMNLESQLSVAFNSEMMGAIRDTYDEVFVAMTDLVHQVKETSANPDPRAAPPPPPPSGEH